MKLWEKGISVHSAIEKFTVGADREMDLYLAPWDVLGSIAHVTMLNKVGLITDEELPVLLHEMKLLHKKALKGELLIEEGVEDIHSQVELELTRSLGETGKKIHSGRSRNDQVLLDLKLFTRGALEEVVENTGRLIDTLITRADETKEVLMPGYTHLQVAMPSSFGLWFGAYAESLTDDAELLQTAFNIANQNPLGSAAGYGSSFPLDRQMTTDLLAFRNLNYNVVYAQMGRGKTERIVAFALANVAATISKLAYDVCLFMSQNFNFVKLPPELTTGSSIMPHKKNPDVFELIRAKCNKIQALPNQITLIVNNLPSGYFRDLQIVKEIFLPLFSELNDCLQITEFAIGNLKVRTDILENDMYNYIFSVEEVNKLVMQGVPFREAYKVVGKQIEEGDFKPDKQIQHTHQGSIGKLCLDKISDRKRLLFGNFPFAEIKKAIDQLISE